MKIYYKKCFWKYVRASFETPGIPQPCLTCDGYRYDCSKYMKSQKADITGLMIMNKNRDTDEKKQETGFFRDILGLKRNILAF